MSFPYSRRLANQKLGQAVADPNAFKGHATDAKALTDACALLLPTNTMKHPDFLKVSRARSQPSDLATVLPSARHKTFVIPLRDKYEGQVRIPFFLMLLSSDKLHRLRRRQK